MSIVEFGWLRRLRLFPSAWVAKSWFVAMASLCAKVSVVLVSLASGSWADPLDSGKLSFEAGEYQKALHFFTEGFRSGDPASGYYLGRMLELGLGVETDKAASVKIFKQSAADGFAAALNRVALMHYRGEESVSQDYQKAAEYFEIAAEMGDANALFNLGKLYFLGQGVPENTDRALTLFRQAAHKDHVLALNTLGALYREGARSQTDLNLARQFFARSAAYGNAVGLYETGRFTLASAETAEDQITAHMYFNLAVARAHPDAIRALSDLTAAMDVEDIVSAQERARKFTALPATSAEQ